VSPFACASDPSNKLKGKEPPKDGVWLLETVMNIPIFWITHPDSDLCLTARYGGLG
jgi:hypothetical protein